MSNTLHINVGEPIVLEDIVQMHRRKKTPEREIYADIANKIEQAMKKLQKKTLEKQKETNIES